MQVRRRACGPLLAVCHFFGHALLMKIVLSVVIFLTSFMFLKGREFLCMHGANKNCIFGSDKFSSPVLFLRINGAS